MSLTTNTLAGPEALVFWDLINDQELQFEWTKTWGPDTITGVELDGHRLDDYGNDLTYDPDLVANSHQATTDEPAATGSPSKAPSRSPSLMNGTGKICDGAGCRPTYVPDAERYGEHGLNWLQKVTVGGLLVVTAVGSVAVCKWKAPQCYRGVAAAFESIPGAEGASMLGVSAVAGSRLLTATGADVAANGGLRALPSGPKLTAQWGADTYRHGGRMSTIEHINDRHAFNSGFKDVSRFAQGTSARDIKALVDQALRMGTVTNRGVIANIGRPIGTGIDGKAVTGLEVIVRDGMIKTAYPVGIP